MCRVCRMPAVDPFMEIRQVPIYCNVLWPTRTQAADAAKGDLNLGFCRHCGHIFNFAFDPDLMDYTVEYENSLHFSPHFQRYAKALAHHLVEKYSLWRKQIVDIGCGKGDFLAALCEIGNNKGIGFDKSYSPENATHKKELELEFVHDFYSEHHHHYHADIFCCRHVLEHIDQPIEFVRGLRRSIGNRSEVVVFFEVPSVMYTLRDLGIWDLIYEHCSYFSAGSLAYLFRDSGFAVNSVSELYDGQFIGIESFPERARTPSSVAGDVTEIQEAVAAFSEKYRRKVQHWKAQFDDFARTGKRTVVWGCGSKGVTFLNICNPQQVEFVVDINPRKHGRYVAGTGQQVVPPNFLLKYNPDVVIVMNDVYRDEISGQVKELGLSPEFIAA